MVTDKEKEACAIMVMRRMIEKFALKYDITFKEAFFKFVSSKTYDMLFDYECAIWREGPDYLMELFEEELLSKNKLLKNKEL